MGTGASRQRFIVVRNPEEMKRDRTQRTEIIAEVERRLAALAQTDGAPHRKAACALRAHPVFGR